MPKTFKFDNGAVNLGTSVVGAVGAISAGAASVGAGTVVFSNSNGVSFGVNGSTVTASVAAGGGGGAGISAGTQSVSTGTVVFSNSNGVTFGMSGSSRITASHNGLTAGIQSLSAGTTRATAGEVVLSNSNGLTFGMNGATITGSYTVPSETPFGLSAGTQSVSTGTMIFANSNGLTFGMSGSSQITASHNGITSQSNQQITAYATGNTTQSSSGTYNASSLVFRGDGVASVGVSNGSVVVSVPAGGGGLTNINVSGGTTSNNLSNLVFADGGGVSFGLNGSTITASAPAAGGGLTNINLSAGTTSQNLSAVTFSNSNGVSFGLNGSVITGSVVPHVTESYYAPYANRLNVAGQQGQGTLHINPMPMPGPLQFDRVVMPINNTNSSNSSGSHTLSFWLGIYTQNASTLSLLASGSQSYALTHSGTAGSYSLYSGMRNVSIGLTTTLNDGDYWLGVLSRTTSGGANGSYSQLLVSQVNSNFLGVFGQSHNATYQRRLGLGVYTATTSDMPTSIAFSQIRGSDSLALRPPVVYFASGTA